MCNTFELEYSAMLCYCFPFQVLKAAQIFFVRRIANLYFVEFFFFFFFFFLIFFWRGGGGWGVGWSTYVKSSPAEKISDKDLQHGEKVPAAQKSFLNLLNLDY